MTKSRSARNNLRHGLRTLALGTLPTGASYVARMTNVLRRELESAVMEAKGQVTLTDAAAINTACRWERHAMLAQRWLRQHAEAMTHDQLLSFSRDVARASESRDRAIQSLGLDRREQDAIAALYSVCSAPEPVDEPESAPAGGNARESESEADGRHDAGNDPQAEPAKNLASNREGQG